MTTSGLCLRPVLVCYFAIFKSMIISTIVVRIVVNVFTRSMMNSRKRLISLGLVTCCNDYYDRRYSWVKE